MLVIFTQNNILRGLKEWVDSFLALLGQEAYANEQPTEEINHDELDNISFEIRAAHPIFNLDFKWAHLKISIENVTVNNINHLLTTPKCTCFNQKRYTYF